MLSMDRQRLDIVGHIRRATGKQYPNLEKALDTMPDEVVRDISRLLGDLRHEQDKAVNNARLFPWKR